MFRVALIKEPNRVKSRLGAFRYTCFTPGAPRTNNSTDVASTSQHNDAASVDVQDATHGAFGVRQAEA